MRALAIGGRQFPWISPALSKASWHDVAAGQNVRACMPVAHELLGTYNGTGATFGTLLDFSFPYRI